MRKPASGPRGYPLIGVLPYLLRDPLGFLTRLGKKYDDLVLLHVGPETVFFINQPDLVKVVFNDPNRAFSKGLFFERQKVTFGDGLLTSDGELWRKQRRLVQPAFHMKRIAALTATMTGTVERSLAAWHAPGAEGRPIDITASMMEITQRIIQRTMFGAVTDAVERQVIEAMPTVLAHLLRIAMSPVNVPTWFPTPANARFRRAMRTIDDVVYSSIAEHRARSRGEDDLISMLLDAKDEDTGMGMDDRQLRDEAVTIYIAGHETTANSLAWALFLLSAYPHVERKLAEEVHAVLGDRVPTFDDLAKLKYTRMVMNEVMRLYPANWVIARTAMVDTMLDDYAIPAGSHVVMSSWVMGRSERYWKDPERFEPERFEPERLASTHRYACFPFGGGARQCIGTNFAQIEQTIILTMIVQRFQLELVRGHVVEPDPLVTVRPKYGLQMYVRPR